MLTCRPQRGAYEARAGAAPLGDRKRLPAVQALGYEVLELDNDGKPVVPAAAPVVAAPTPEAAPPAR